ncbi:VPLPA-CTERM sorting domain-containing protein [Roseobacter sp. YSTF-M11]|uniref:VPLPA-CTERM sorting domain-containing protein n=1 Tax=Roseobacter insulae TaxID=2859783 RepID=A0A9X1FVP9_9RHOB|nr:VPLPA-CTERM sorting domain-containing protein [Roseobacter insulae]MBW4708502.1 VPLPA-CTERM sorting domain-containing protein [Roseobacter insulae]
MKLTALAAAAALSLGTLTGSAYAATLSGNFLVKVVNYSAGGKGRNAKANQENFNARYAAAGTGFADQFMYRGSLDFLVNNNPKDLDLETIGDFLSTGSGIVSGLDADVAAKRLSTPTFDLTTLFSFTEVYANAFDVIARHDDGISIYDDGARILSFENPTGVRTTGTGAFDGGAFTLVYAAANGNPSVLNVMGDGVPAVPLPASALLLVGALSGFGAMARRKARKTA